MLKKKRGKILASIGNVNGRSQVCGFSYHYNYFSSKYLQKPSISKLVTTSGCTPREAKGKHDCRSSGSFGTPSRSVQPISNTLNGSNPLETIRGRRKMLKLSMQKLQHISCRDHNLRLHVMLVETICKNYTSREITRFNNEKQADVKCSDTASVPVSSMDNYKNIEEDEDFRSDLKRHDFKDEADGEFFLSDQFYTNDKSGLYSNVRYNSDPDYPQYNGETSNANSPVGDFDQGKICTNYFDQEKMKPMKSNEEKEENESFQMGSSILQELWSELLKVFY